MIEYLMDYIDVIGQEPRLVAAIEVRYGPNFMSNSIEIKNF